MLRKVIYETDEHRIIIQKNGDNWLLQVFEGTGGTHIVEWEEFESLGFVQNYVENKYNLQECDLDE